MSRSESLWLDLCLGVASMTMIQAHVTIHPHTRVSGPWTSWSFTKQPLLPTPHKPLHRDHSAASLSSCMWIIKCRFKKKSKHMTRSSYVRTIYNTCVQCHVRLRFTSHRIDFYIVRCHLESKPLDALWNLWQVVRLLQWPTNKKSLIPSIHAPSLPSYTLLAPLQYHMPCETSSEIVSKFEKWFSWKKS